MHNPCQLHGWHTQVCCSGFIGNTKMWFQETVQDVKTIILFAPDTHDEQLIPPHEHI